VLLGGVLTGLLTWHWIFLVNVPIGIAVWVLVTRLVADTRPDGRTGSLDVTGAALVTVALMLAVYGVVGGNDAGWSSGRTLGILAAAVALLVVFVVREARIENPLVPLRLFALRNVSISQVVGVLWAGAMFACFFLSALYLQGVLGYDALQVGLAYLPSCAVMAVMSLRVSDRLVMKYGVRPPLVVGLGLVAVSLALFALAPVDGVYVVHVLPPMVLLGLGAGIAFNPVLLAAMGDVEPHEAGLASGVVNTSFMMGGALGLAVLVAISSSRTGSLVSSGAALPEALTGGYQVAFAAGAVMAAAAAAVGGVFLRPRPMGGHQAPADPEPEAELETFAA
jgi:MFS family permease